MFNKHFDPTFLISTTPSTVYNIVLGTDVYKIADAATKSAEVARIFYGVNLDANQALMAYNITDTTATTIDMSCAEQASGVLNSNNGILFPSINLGIRFLVLTANKSLWIVGSVTSMQFQLAVFDQYL